MIVVVDANILFSALIRNSITAEIFFDEELRLFTPEFILQEFFKYEGLIMEKTNRTREQIITLMHQLKDLIIVIPQEEYSKFIKKAELISPDEKDVMYFALALKLNCGIWSNDNKLKDQKEVTIYSTKEILEMLL